MFGWFATFKRKILFQYVTAIKVQNPAVSRNTVKRRHRQLPVQFYPTIWHLYENGYGFRTVKLQGMHEKNQMCPLSIDLAKQVELWKKGGPLPSPRKKKSKTKHGNMIVTR